MASKKAGKKSKAKASGSTDAKKSSGKSKKQSVVVAKASVKQGRGVYPGQRFGSQAHTLAGLYRKHKIVAGKDGETFTAEFVEQLAAEQQAAEDKDTALYEAWQANHLAYSPGAAKRGATFSRALDAARSLLKDDKVAMQTLKDAQFHTGKTGAKKPKGAPPDGTGTPTK